MNGFAAVCALFMLMNLVVVGQSSIFGVNAVPPFTVTPDPTIRFWAVFELIVSLCQWREIIRDGEGEKGNLALFLFQDGLLVSISQMAPAQERKKERKKLN